MMNNSLDKNLPVTTDESTEKKPIKTAGTRREKKKRTKSKKTGSIVLAVLILILGTASYFLLQSVIKVGASALMDGYSTAFDDEREETYQKIYQKFYDDAEEKYHVRNRGSISIGDIRETGKLEVLKVSDVEFIIDEKDQTEGNVVSWLEVPGEGTFVVDLQAAEFIVDNERVHVLVRIPNPELTNISIDYKNVDKLLFKDNIFNGSYRQGEDLARKQLSEGDLLIRKEFSSNPSFYHKAQDAAVSTITYLVKQLNPDETDLVVDVEFY